MKRWLLLYNQWPDVRATYCNAVSEDRKVDLPDMPCYLCDLMLDLTERLKSAGRESQPHNVLAVHLSAIVASSYTTNQDKVNDAKARISKLANNEAILTEIEAIAYQLSAKLTRSSLQARVKSSLTKLINLFLKHTEELKAIDWEPQCSAVFLKCATALWARWLQNQLGEPKLAASVDGDLLQQLFTLPVPDQPNQLNLVIPQDDMLRSHLESGIPEDELREALLCDLLKIWYASALSSDSLETKLFMVN